MKRYFCDACEKEINPNKGRLNILEVPCHLYSLKNKLCYSDSEGNHVSGRRDSIDLCNRCWNEANIGALKAIGLFN